MKFYLRFSEKNMTTVVEIYARGLVSVGHDKTHSIW